MLARLMTLDIHDAWPCDPKSCFPRPRLCQSACTLALSDVASSDRLPLSDPTLKDMGSASCGSEAIAAYEAITVMVMRVAPFEVVARPCAGAWGSGRLGWMRVRTMREEKQPIRA